MARRAGILLVVLSLVVLGVVGAAVGGARQSVPGDLLYPVKRAAESVRITFTPYNARTALHITLVSNRIEELWAVFGAGRASPEMIDALTFDMLAQTDLALQYIDSAPEALRPDLLQRLLARIDLQQTMLATLLQNSSEMEQMGLLRALGELQVQRDVAEALLGIAQSTAAVIYLEITPNATGAPTATQPAPVQASAMPNTVEPTPSTDRSAPTSVARFVLSLRGPSLITPTATHQAATGPPASSSQISAPTVSATVSQPPAPTNQAAPPVPPTVAPSSTPPPVTSPAQPTAGGPPTATTTPTPISLSPTSPPSPVPPTATPEPTATLAPTATPEPTATPCPTNPGGRPVCRGP